MKARNWQRMGRCGKSAKEFPCREGRRAIPGPRHAAVSETHRAVGAQALIPVSRDGRRRRESRRENPSAFQHHYLNTGPGQQKTQHDSGGSAADHTAMRRLSSLASF